MEINPSKYHQELNNAKDFYLKIFDDFPALIWRSDTDKSCNFFNKSWLEFRGRTMEQELGNGWTQGVHPDDFDFCLETYTRAFDKRENFEMEYRLKNKTGDYCCIQDFGQPFYNQDKTFLGYIGFCYDISDRKKIEHQLKKSEQNYRNLFEHSAIPIWEEDFSGVKAHFEKLKSEGVRDFRYHFENHTEEIYMLVELIKIVDINETSVKFFNVKSKDDIHKNLIHYFSEVSIEIFKDELVALSTGETHFECEIPIKSIIGEIKYLQLFLQVCPGYEDTLSKIYVSFTDITKIKKTENDLIISKEKIEESEIKYRTIVNSLPQFISYINKDLIYEFVNDTYLQRFNLQKESVFGKPLIELIGSNSLQKAKPHLDRTLLGETVNYSEHFVYPNGLELYIDGTLIPKMNQDNDVEGYFAVLNDVTERVLNTKKIEESEHKYRLLAENSSDVVWLIDLNLQFKYISPSVEKVFGYTLDEAHDLHIDKICEPETISWLKSILKLRIDEFHSTNSFSPQIYELECIHKNGSKVFTEISVKFITDSNNNILAIQGTSRDISDRKKTEQTINKLQKAVESSMACIVITDREGNIEYTNPYFTDHTGYTPEESLGKNPRILKTDLHNRSYYKQLWNTIKSGNTWEGEFCNRKKTGEVFWEKAVISPIWNKNTEITHFVAIKTDITEAKKINEELVIAKERAEESDRLKTAFLENISHEVRTPINAILGFSMFLLKPDLTEEKKKQYTEILHKSTNQLLTIVENTVTLAHIETKQIHVNSMFFSPNDLINELFTHYGYKKQILGKSHIDLAVNKSVADDFKIFSDYTRLNQIFGILLDNSLKFTENGKVEFGYSLTGKAINFYVKDTGIGIPSEKQKVIFKSFTQSDLTIRQSFGGLGVGLTIALGLIKLLHGEIKISSHKNKGTEIIFSLPF
jgi:PAS domain S-box-containing protein